MGKAQEHRELAEVLVRRHHDTVLVVRPAQGLFVPRVLVSVCYECNLMSGGAQVSGSTGPHARVDQQSHVPGVSDERNSILSCATNR